MSRSNSKGNEAMLTCHLGLPMNTKYDSTECIVAVSVTMLLYHDIYKAALTVMLMTRGK